MNCIVNVTAQWGIGLEGKLQVSISADMKRFRALTTGKTVILGRKTLATFPGGRPLKNRTNIILTRDPDFTAEGALIARSTEEALRLCASDPENAVEIGGESVYRALLPFCDTAQVTKTMLDMPADAWFPDLDKMPGWHIANESAVYEENGISYRFVDYVNEHPRQIG